MKKAIATVAAVSLLTALAPAGAQTVYRCEDAAGNAVFSDISCSNFVKMEKMTVQPNSVDTANAREQRYLQEIQRLRQQNAILEQQNRMTASGRTYADLQAERGRSFACTQALRSYEMASESTIGAKRLAAYNACGIPEPGSSHVDVRTSNNYYAPPPPESLRLR